jgi:hypothetical protein
MHTTDFGNPAPIFRLMIGLALTALTASAYTNPNGIYPIITPGTSLSFKGPGGESIQLVAMQGTRDTVYANTSSHEAVSVSDLANSPAIVAYSYASSAHSEDFEGDAVKYTLVNTAVSHTYDKDIAADYKWESYTSQFGSKTEVYTYSRPTALPPTYEAAYDNGLLANPNVLAPLAYYVGGEGLSLNGAPSGYLEFAKNITTEIDVTTSAGVYRMVRTVPSYAFGGALYPTAPSMYAVYVPGSQKLYFAGDNDVTVSVYAPSGALIYTGSGLASDPGFVEIDNIASISDMAQTGTWESPVDSNYEASQPQYYMTANSPELAPQPPAGMISASTPQVETGQQPVTISWQLD